MTIKRSSRPGAGLCALILCLLTLAFALSCAGLPKDADIPAGASAKQIIQRAQEANDQYKYKTAAAYYRIALDRFPEDLSVVCSCEYEIAFLDYKQGRYKESQAGFEKLLDRYASPDAALLPQEFKILAEKILPKVKAKLKTAS